MRVDGKPEGLRQSMSWLHTWSGLLLGWLLYAVFFTGTLSYFVDEITVWMKPELHQSMPSPHTAEKALAGMQQLAPDAATWTLNLPGERHPSVQASWRAKDAAPGRAGTQRAELNAATGEAIPVRETRGGSFLYRFHFELYALPRIWARWVVGIATMFMFVAIISGVITHKKIFTDFFTFRSGKQQRSWLDAHNMTAILALPFHLMITFSGLLLFMVMLMPWGASAVYEGDTRAYFSEVRAGNRPAAVEQPRRKRSERGEHTASQDAVTMTPIAPLMALAQQRWPERGVGAIVVSQPNTPVARIELRSQGGSSLINRGGSERMVFDGITGAEIDAPVAPSVSTPTAIYNVLTAAHLGRFADPLLRWLLFLSGVVGTLMAATGMVLWVVKRLPERRKLGRTPRLHRLVEVLNVGSIAGLSIATAAYFVANRLIPADTLQRSDWEIRSFFIVWLLCAVHGLLRSHRRAWVEQLALAALLFGSLPLLNAVTGGLPLTAAMGAGLWSVAGFDMVALVLAAIHGFAAFKLLRSPQPQPLPAKKVSSAQANGAAATLAPQAQERPL